MVDGPAEAIRFAGPSTFISQTMLGGDAAIGATVAVGADQIPTLLNSKVALNRQGLAGEEYGSCYLSGGILGNSPSHG